MRTLGAVLAMTTFCSCGDRTVDVDEAAPQMYPMCPSPLAGVDTDSDFGSPEGLVDVVATENYLG